MHAWKNLHRHFEKQISTESAAKQFEELRNDEPYIRQFRTPQEMVSFLISRSGDAHEQNQVYRALLRCQRHYEGATGRLASTLVWLGLWPALDALYRGFAKRNPNRSADELCSDVSLAFSAVMSRIDPVRVRRMMSTMIRNTKRELVAFVLRDSDADSVPTPEPELRQQLERDQDVQAYEPDLPLLLADLEGLHPEDADLILRLVEGDSAAQIARETGVCRQTGARRIHAAQRRAQQLLSKD